MKRRPLIILLILLLLFAIFFYFFLGTPPESVAKEVNPPPATASYLDDVIQKNYPNYVYLEGIGYVQKDRRAVIFPSDSTSQSSHSEEIKAIEKKLESYWKWQILLGRKDLEEINSEKRKDNKIGILSKEGGNIQEGSDKNIFKRFFDIFKVADAVNVIIDKSQSCDCDPNFLLLSGPDLHRIKATLNPDTPVIASGGTQSDFTRDSDIRANFMKQTSAEPQVGYGKQTSAMIGIIDSGINFGTIGLSPDPTMDYNFLDHSANVADASAGIHGTEIAKIVKVNTAPVAMKYVGLKTFDEKSVGNLYHNLCAILYSIKHNIKIVNVSWGVSVNTPAFEAVMKIAQKANVIVVCSAGNHKVDIDVKSWYPACYADNADFKNNIISVTSKHDSIVCQNTSNSESKIDVSVESDSACKYDGLIGTSFAAPYAVAELVKYQVSHPTFIKSNFVASLPTTSKVKKFRK
jgi:Subtilase family